jgi:hypothetical protein
MSYQACIEELLVLGTADWIPAGEVASVCMTVGGAASESDVRELSLQVIADLLKRGLMEAGDVTSTGFRVWPESVTEAISRIKREWRALGHNPSLGDICWLQSTRDGRSLGTRLDAQRR